MKVEYRSNNSGGDWWLTDADWEALKAAGWTIEPLTRPDPGGRWLGAIAVEASLECETPAEAIRSFEKATGKDASDEGCNCCGAPHSFSWPGGYASGEDIVELLYQGSPKTLREAAEKLNGGAR